MSPYEVLGVRPDATRDEARDAYIRLVRRWHPDRFAGDPDATRRAEQKMKEINEAWAIVSRSTSHVPRGASRGSRRMWRPVDLSDEDPWDFEPATGNHAEASTPVLLVLAPLMVVAAVGLLGVSLVLRLRVVLAAALIVGMLGAVGMIAAPIVMTIRQARRFRAQGEKR